MRIDPKYLWKKLLVRAKNKYAAIADKLGVGPRDFAWKLRWRMKYDHNPEYVRVQDKLKVKEYAAEKGVKTADTYYVTERAETIPFDELPEKYFIKANHGCAWNILYKDGEFYNWVSGEALIERDLSKSIITREECLRLCNRWLSSRYSKEQWAYQHIEPKLFVEEKLESPDGNELTVYRCFVFDGVVKVINEDSPMYKMGIDVFVDADWKLFEVPRHYERPPDPLPEKPENLREIVKTAEKLGAAFDFIRVDLYDTTKGIVLGEMTVYPEGGAINTPTTDPDFNHWLGKQWKLPEVSVSNIRRKPADPKSTRSRLWLR